MAQHTTHLLCNNTKLKWSELMQREPQQFDEPGHISTGSDHNAGLKHLCLTKSELADHLRMSTRQVELLVKEGRLPRPVRLSGHPRWVLDDVREWLRNFPKDAQ